MSLAEDYGAKLEEFRDLMARLDEAESALYANYDNAVSIGVEGEWREQFATVNAYKSGVQATLDFIGGVGDVWNSVTGAFGFSGLGAIPVVLPTMTIAGMTALAAAAAAAIITVYSTIAFWDERRADKLVAGGMTRQQADATVYPNGKPLGAVVTDSLMWIALGIAAVFVLPKVIK